MWTEYYVLRFCSSPNNSMNIISFFPTKNISPNKDKLSTSTICWCTSSSAMGIKWKERDLSTGYGIHTRLTWVSRCCHVIIRTVQTSCTVSTLIHWHQSYSTYNITYRYTATCDCVWYKHKTVLKIVATPPKFWLKKRSCTVLLQKLTYKISKIVHYTAHYNTL